MVAVNVTALPGAEGVPEVDKPRDGVNRLTVIVVEAEAAL
jgi:hypothetical protein